VLLPGRWSRSLQQERSGEPEDRKCFAPRPSGLWSVADMLPGLELNPRHPVWLGGRRVFLAPSPQSAASKQYILSQCVTIMVIFFLLVVIAARTGSHRDG